MSDLAQTINQKLMAAGWKTAQNGDMLEAEREAILSKWFLGTRKVKHRLRLNLDSAARQLTLRETALEVSIGIPPPTFSVTTTRQTGAKVTETRTDRGFGGGTLHYGEPRQWIEQECASAGWTFRLQAV